MKKKQILFLASIILIFLLFNKIEGYCYRTETWEETGYTEIYFLGEYYLEEDTWHKIPFNLEKGIQDVFEIEALNLNAQISLRGQGGLISTPEERKTVIKPGDMFVEVSSDRDVRVQASITQKITKR